jgi:hypothetical protein
LDAERHYTHLLGHGRLSRAFGAPHAQVLICFLFIQIPKMPLSSLYNYIKKNHYEKTKRPLDSRLKLFAFTGIFVISLCVLIVYYFYIWSKNKLSLHYNNEKNHCGKMRMPLDAKFKFLLLMIFWSFYYAIEMRKDSSIPNEFCNN